MVRKSNSFGVVIWLLVGSVTFSKSTLVLAEGSAEKSTTTVKAMHPSTGHTTSINKNNQFIGNAPSTNGTVVQQSETRAGDNNQTSKPVDDKNTGDNVSQQSGTQAGNENQTSKPVDDMNTGDNVSQQSGTQAGNENQTSKPVDDKNTGDNVSQQSGTQAGDNNQTSTPADDMNTGNNVSQQSGTQAGDNNQISKPAGDMNNGDNVLQQSGTMVVSISDVLLQASQSTTVNKKPFATDAIDAQTSALGIRTTPKVSFKSDINIAAKPAVEDDHFIMYLILGLLLLSVVYIAYHNKNKVISLCQKGGPKRTKRPKTSDYQRLDQNLSEVITSLKKKSNFKMS